MGGGGGGTPSTTDASTKQKTDVTVTNNITGPPISINVGSEVLSPIAKTFAPMAEGLQSSFSALQVGFQDSELRRAKQEDLTAAALMQNQDMQKLIVYALIGFAALQLIQRSKTG